MKYRKAFVLGSIITGVALIAVFIFLTGRSAFANNLFGFNNSQPELPPAREGNTILARRLISVPFGIQDTLVLSSDGQTLTVKGHGDCLPGGKSFTIDTTVSQDIDVLSGVLPNSGQNYLLEIAKGQENGAPVGHTQAQCVSGGRAQWEAQIKLTGSDTYTTGAALACGHVVVQNEDGSTDTGDWCKNVLLTTQ